jgi:hypothetical protein
MEAAQPEGSTGGRWLDRAERFSDAFGLVFLLVLLTYVLASLLSNQGWPAVIIATSATATSVVALASSGVRLPLVRLAALVAIAATGLAAISAASGERTWLNVSSVVEIGLLTVAMLAVLRRVLTSAEIGFRTILGAISFYAVMGILFTSLYSTVDRIQSGPFFEGVAHPGGSDFLFFSYTTLTTTGYGNLVPAAQPGRMFAGLEMMLGQIFLVTLVAGLVSLWRPGDAIRRRRAARETGPEEPAAP